MLNRRALITAAGVLGLTGTTVSCANKDTEVNSPETTSETETNPSMPPGNSAEQDVLMNGALIFGPEDFYLTKTIVLDLGSRKSKEFYNNHVETLKNSYDDFRGIGICLTDFSDMTEEAHGAVYALNAATVAISVFEENRELFWDYLSSVYEQLEVIEGANEDTDEEHHDHESHEHEESDDHSHEHSHSHDHSHSNVPDLDINDLTELAIEVGVADTIKDRISEPVVEMLVRNMTMTVEGIVDESPALLENRKAWSGDISNIDEVDEWLNREF